MSDLEVIKAVCSLVQSIALLICAVGLFFEDKTLDTDSLAVRLWPNTMLRFERLTSSPDCFAAMEVLYANSHNPHPPALVEGVLWSRRAILSDGRCSAFCQSGANRRLQYGPGSTF